MRRNTIATLLGTSMLALAMPANAQDAVDEDDASSIVVTGTRIVRDGYTAPTPVTVATVEELVKSTPTNIPDALNKLPQFQNSLSPSRSASNFSNLPIHGNILNLRGLGLTGINPKGPLRTLVLFDGVRVAPTTYLGMIDTDVLPNMLVQRVDVVTGGASAAYGSDAVAGVVNFVLDRKFTGLKATAQAGISSRGDMANQRIGAAFGTAFGGDRGHFLLSAEYFNSNGLSRNKRPIGRDGYSFTGLGTVASPFVISPDVRIGSASEFGKILAVGNPFNNFRLTSTGALVPFVNGPATTNGFQIGGDGYRIPDRTTAIKPYKTYQGFARVAYDVADDVNLYAQVTVARQDLKYEALSNGLVLAAAGTVNLYKGNPFLPAALDASIPAGGFVGFNAYWGDSQPTKVNERTDFWQVTTGVDAQFGNFDFKANYTHGQSTHNMAQSDIWDWRKFYAAADVVSVGGVPTCRVLTDPAFASAFAGCQPLNLLNGPPSVSSPGAYAWANGTSRYRAMFKQDSVAATISGSLFDLPAGPVDLVLGAEYRKQSLDLTSNADGATLPAANAASAAITARRNAYFAGLRGVAGGAQYYWLTNVGIANGSLNVKEAFAEAAVPLLKDTPGFQELSLNGAVRLTDYSFSGSVTTWKLGATWKPIDDLLFRAALSRDIRAPNLYELFAGDSSTISTVLDPVSGTRDNVAQVIGGNRLLKPETAKTLTVGGVFSPSGLPGFSLSLDYYRIRLSGAISGLTAQQILDNCAAFGASTPECSLITRPTASAFPTSVRITEANISFLKTSGFDIDMTYRTGIGQNGKLAVRLYANYLNSFTSQNFVGQPVIEFADANVVASNPAGYPRWRGSLSVDYTNGAFGFTLTESYIGKMSRFLNQANYTNSNYVSPGQGAVAYTDLSLRYTVNRGEKNEFEFFTVINNLFDKDPPLIPGVTPGVNFPTNFALYDVIGRAFTAGVRVKF